MSKQMTKGEKIGEILEEIAKILGIHNKTVENIIRYTLRNTNSYNRTHLACKYVEMRVKERMLQDG